MNELDEEFDERELLDADVDNMDDGEIEKETGRVELLLTGEDVENAAYVEGVAIGLLLLVTP